MWHRSQNAQKYLVLDLDSQLGGAEQAQLPFTSFPDVSGGAESSIMALAPSSMPNFLDADINNVSGMVDLFLDLYYRLFNPDKSSTDLLRPGRECGGWRSLLPQWIGQSDILDTAILALATCFIGTQYQNEDLLNKSQDWYLETMRMIQEVLPEPNSSQRKDLLATTLVMASLELFMGNGGGPSHFTHIDGATRLLQAGFQSSSFDETHIYVLNQGVSAPLFMYYMRSVTVYHSFLRPYRPDADIRFHRLRTVLRSGNSTLLNEHEGKNYSSNGVRLLYLYQIFYIPSTPSLPLRAPILRHIHPLFLPYLMKLRH